MVHINYTPHVVVFIAAFLLSACNAFSTSSTSNKPSELTDYLPYQVFSRSRDNFDHATEIAVVSAKNPNEHISVETNDFGHINVFNEMFETGQFNSETFTVNHYHATHILYSNTKNNVGMLMALPIYQVRWPEPFRISNERVMYRACADDLRRGNDYLDSGNSRLVYKIMPTLDLTDCAYKTGEYRMVKLSTPKDEAPATLPSTINYIVEPIHDLKTLALTGWLVVDDQKLTRYDLEFQNAQRVTKDGAPVTVVNHARLLVRTREHHFLMIVDNHLYHYDPRSESNTISSNHAGYIPDENVIVDQYVSDGTTAYFTVSSKDASSNPNVVYGNDLYRLPLRSGGSAEKILSEATGIPYITLTNGYLAFMTGGQERTINDEKFVVYTIVRRLRLSDQAVETMPLPSDVDYLYALRSEKNFLYVNVKLKEPNPYFSLFVFKDADSEAERFDHYRLVGTVFDHELHGYREAFGSRYFMFFQHNPTTNDQLLFSMDAMSGKHKAHVGVFPSRVFDMSADFSFSIRGHTVGLFHIPVPGDGHFNLYFFDSEKDDSLHKVPAAEYDQNRAIYHKANNLRPIIKPIVSTATRL